jgi:hypothetical protein
MPTINAGTGIVYANDGLETLNLQGGGSTAISVNPNAPYVKTVSNTSTITGTSGMLVYNTAVGGLSGYTNGFWETITAVSQSLNNTRGIFGYGANSSSMELSISNLVSTTGVVATDTTGVGTARLYLTASSYGTDKAIFGYGSPSISGSPYLSMTNLVSNSGVVSSDTTGVGTQRRNLAATQYGGDKAIFGYGFNGAGLSMTNLVSSTGVVAADTTGVGTARDSPSAAKFGITGQAIFAYGSANVSNIVSNTGVVATDVSAPGIAKQPSSAPYGTSGQAIFAFGSNSTNIFNLLSNTGIIASDTTGVGTTRNSVGGSPYGGDKAIFAYGTTTGGGGGVVSISNLVSNTGVIATDTAGVGTSRFTFGAAGYSTT